MSTIDQRDRLKENPFSYKILKSNKAMIYFENKMVMTLSERDTFKLIRRVENKDDFETQLALAKVTGNFKHGNER